jgi:hypothetical protein
MDLVLSHRFAAASGAAAVCRPSFGSGGAAPDGADEEVVLERATDAVLAMSVIPMQRRTSA